MNSTTVIMDLKPKQGAEFVVSSKGKSATLSCEFTGRYNSTVTADIELVVGSAASRGRPITTLVKELSEHVKSGGLLRATGQFDNHAWQERATGAEHEKLCLFAYFLEPSDEVQPIYSLVSIIGNVKLTEGSGERMKDGLVVSHGFCVTTPPPPFGFEKSTFLTFWVQARGEQVQRVSNLKSFGDKSYVSISGKLEAGKTGMLRVRLFDIGYAKYPKRKE